jgi:hypothetical protein
MGQKWNLVTDFHAINPLNTTTGRPFVTSLGTLLVPLWSVLYYTEGVSWFSIVRSEDDGATWQTAYCSETQTYGNHFFQSPIDGSIYIGVGIGGGGNRGIISYTPSEATLLKSDDDGRSWKNCFHVGTPTALYDGVVTEEGIVVVSARERCSVFVRKPLQDWNEIVLDKMVRCLGATDDTLVLSNDDAVFSSVDSGFTWERHDAPFSPLVLRYPTPHRKRILLTSVGSKSLLVELSQDFQDWRVRNDLTKAAGTRYLARMAVLGECAFLGDEIEAGVLLKVDLAEEDVAHSHDSIGLESLQP